MTAGVIALPRTPRNRERFNDFYTVPVQALRDAEHQAAQKATVAACVEARFGPRSDIARMLGVAS